MSITRDGADDLTHNGPPTGEAQFLYDAEDVIAEYDGPLLLREFVHGPGYDEPLVMNRDLNADLTAVDPVSDERLFYVHDALGSVVALEDTNGFHVEGYIYDAYGEAYTINVGADDVLTWGQAGSDDFLTPGSAYDNPYTFTSQRADPETGLMYYKARYYDPEQGRFISRDPIGIWMDSVNLGNGYAYVGNRPYSANDPSGEAWNYLIGAVGGCIVGGVTGLTMSDGEFWSKKRWGNAGKGCGVGAASGVLIASLHPYLIGAGISMYLEEIDDLREDGDINGGGEYFGAAVGGSVATFCFLRNPLKATSGLGTMAARGGACLAIGAAVDSLATQTARWVFTDCTFDSYDLALSTASSGAAGLVAGPAVGTGTLFPNRQLVAGGFELIGGILHRVGASHVTDWLDPGERHPPGSCAY